MNDVFRRFRFSWYSVLLASSLALAAVLVVSDARTNDRAPVTGQPAGLDRPTAVAPPTTSAATAPVDRTGPQVTTNPDAALWENGELLAPLPHDPALRRQALDQAMANAMARPIAGGVEHVQLGANGTAPVGGSRSTEDPILAVTPYIPPEVRNGEKTWALKLPDKFVADPEVLNGVDPATGEPLVQAIQDKALAAAFAPSLTQSWEGIAQTNLRPPDPDVSAGPSHVIAVVNARFAIYDKCGNNLYENDIASFVGDGTNFFFDPKVIYDIWDGRWVITACVKNNATHGSWVILLVSDDSDPIGNWCWYYLDFVQGSGFWADYQDVGTSPDGIHISANMFDWSVPFNFFQYARLINIDKAGVLACGSTCYQNLFGMVNPGDGFFAFSLRTCDMNSWPGDFWLVNDVSYGGNFLTLWRLSGPVCGGTLTAFNVPVVAYDDPPPSQQPNLTYIDCGDARLLNASYYAGNIWTAQGIRYNWGGGAPDVSILRAYQLQPYALTVSFQGAVGTPGYSLAYPAVDFDNAFNGIVAASFVGTAAFGSSIYLDLGNGGPWGGSFNYLAAGLTNYNDLVNAGTAGDPFRWGDYYGCDLDPYDGKTLWMFGQYTATATTWGTRVGATAPNGPGVLTVTPSPGLVSGGFVGGPFNPGDVWYLVENTGGSALSWSLSGVDFWNTASQFGGQLGPSQWTWVNVAINAAANGFGLGVSTDNYTFDDCYLGSAAFRSTTLHVGRDGSCVGSDLALIPPGAPGGPYVDGIDVERGVYVTAIKDFTLCSIGYKMVLATLPFTLEARVYAATGTTRGALLASNTIGAAQLDDRVHYIPINYTLQACQDYEIVVIVPSGAAWEAWSEFLITEPFDVGGVIRVRDGSSFGSAANFLLPHFELSGSAPSPTTVTDLGGPGAPPLPAPDVFQERGVFVRMLDTAQLCSFGWEADLVPGQTLTARVYESAGLVRGAVIAEGTYDVTSGGSMWHDIPINAQLVEGREYDVAITFGLTNNWQWWDENTFPMPFAAGVFEVITSEEGGWGGNFALPHYRAGWDEKTGGTPFNMPKITDVFPAPNSTSQGFSDYGAYVTSQIDQQVYSVGWMADVPQGQPITARVYEATGTTRGALISEGTAYSKGPGMQFHDIPLAVEMMAGTDYDISFSWNLVNEWRWWWDTFGMPYTINGVIEVRDGEAFGGDAASWGALPHMRMFACDALLTPVQNDLPVRTPMFLATPAPNPVTSASRLDFAMEEAGPVSIVVYDVAGRRVATLLEGNRPQGWNSIHLDSSQMASGVYFLKMQTSMKAVSRKFVVTH